MSRTLLEILIIIILILANGVLAMIEMARASSRRARLTQRAERGEKGARTALELIDTPTRYLSTLQIGITLIGILAGAFGGATLTDELAAWLARFPPLAPYAATLSLVLVVMLVTYLSLVVGELIPKRLALTSPEKFASSTAGFMLFLTRLIRPAVALLTISTEAGIRLLGIKPSGEPPVTQEEIEVLIEQGAQVGIIDEAEQDMVEGVFRLGERRVGALMTPRMEITFLDVDDPIEMTLETVLESRHTRFPVIQEAPDNVLGILAAKDLLAARLTQPQVKIEDLLQPPVFVPESTPALKMLEIFKDTGVQMTLVIDEYGGVQGLVTIHDVLEAIVGDIRVAGQSGAASAIQRDDGSWLIDGMLPVDEFKDLLNLPHLPEEDRIGYQTVAGFVIHQLGAIPTAGTRFSWNDYRFEVVDMDGMRVDKVMVTRENPAEKTPGLAV
jgi:putative hemolysin